MPRVSRTSPVPLQLPRLDRPWAGASGGVVKLQGRACSAQQLSGASHSGSTHSQPVGAADGEGAEDKASPQSLARHEALLEEMEMDRGGALRRLSRVAGTLRRPHDHLAPVHKDACAAGDADLVGAELCLSGADSDPDSPRDRLQAALEGVNRSGGVHMPLPNAVATRHGATPRPSSPEDGNEPLVAPQAAECGVCLDRPVAVAIAGCRRALCGECCARLCALHHFKPAACPFCRLFITGFEAAC